MPYILIPRLETPLGAQKVHHSDRAFGSVSVTLCPDFCAPFDEIFNADSTAAVCLAPRGQTGQFAGFVLSREPHLNRSPT
jgi:hypothetical protein